MRTEFQQSCSPIGLGRFRVRFVFVEVLAYAEVVDFEVFVPGEIVSDVAQEMVAVFSSFQGCDQVLLVVVRKVPFVQEEFFKCVHELGSLFEFLVGTIHI